MCKSGLLGKMSRLEVHHIFPKAQELLHGDTRWLVGAAAVPAKPVLGSGITSEKEEQLEELNDWIDRAWPNGIQAEFSQPPSH